MSEISTYEIDCIQDGEKPIQTPEHDEMQHAEVQEQKVSTRNKQMNWQLTRRTQDSIHMCGMGGADNHKGPEWKLHYMLL